jgi:hypothetical protein
MSCAFVDTREEEILCDIREIILDSIINHTCTTNLFNQHLTEGIVSGSVSLKASKLCNITKNCVALGNFDITVNEIRQLKVEIKKIYVNK